MAKNRWYDEYEKLSKHLHSMENMSSDQRDELIAGIAGILKDHNVNLNFPDVFAFPVELPRRRWYDKDPYMWLIMNGLQRADRSTIHEVEEFFENQTGV